jgi:signal transduction histidine kinase
MAFLSVVLALVHCLSIAPMLYAQDRSTVILDNAILQQKKLALDITTLSVLEDSMQKLTFHEALQGLQGGKFVPFHENMLPLHPPSAYWLAFEVQNSVPSQEQWVLHFGDNSARAVARNSFIDVFVVLNGELAEEKHSGYHRPAWERDLPHAYNAVQISLPSNQSTLVLVRLERLFGFSPNAKMHIYSPGDFERAYNIPKQYHLSISFFLLGTFAVMGLFYGIYAFIIQDLTYLYYVSYVLGVCLLFAYLLGVINSSFFPDNPFVENYIFFISLALASFEPLFVRSFIKIDTFSPTWGKILHGFFIVEFAAAVVCFGIWFFNRHFPTVNNILLIVTMMIVLSQLVFSFQMMRSERRLVQYVVIANVILYGSNLLFLLIMLLPQYFDIKLPIDFSSGVYVACAGASGRIALFALGFGYRSKMQEEERLKVQDDLIRQLQRNDELQKLTNYELELKVRERTAELETTNEQLTEANREIERQLVILEEQAGEIEIRNAEMHEINEELALANEFKLKMLGIAAHDLKNPISNILLSAQLLNRKAQSSNDSVREYSESIRESSTQMLSIIDDLLESAKIGLGKVELEVRSFDIAKMLRTMAQQYGRLLEAKHQQLHASLPEQCLMQGDETRIHQVFDNLLSNASKYSPVSSVIELRLETFGELVQISVQDHGQGFSEEDKSQLFGMFQRLSAKPTGGESSSGVGLASVKNIIELHGGRIDVFSEQGKGSTFIVKLPILAG